MPSYVFEHDVYNSPEAGSSRAAPADDNVDVFRARKLKHMGRSF